MLYTSYIHKLNTIPDDAIKILIMQYVPRSMDLERYSLDWKPELAPDKFNRYKFKKDISRDELFEQYKSQLFKSPAKDTIKGIVEKLKENKDVYLICCEKELFECHRRILAQYIYEEYGFEWKEFKEEDIRYA